LLTLALTAGGFYLTARYPGSIQHVPINGFSVPVPLFWLVPIMSWVFLFNRLYDHLYIIASDHVRVIKGRFSFSKKDMRIEYHNIRGIEVDRNLYGRIVNVGSIRVGTAMTNTPEIILDDVSNPSRYRDIIISKMNEYLSAKPELIKASINE